MKFALVSALAFCCLSAVYAYSYVGCFVDKPKRILEGKFTSSTKMTVEMCVQICTERGDYFAAVEYASQCFCGKNMQAYNELSDSECSTPCKGDASQKCGGTWKASVYTTNENYRGCYEDKAKRILEGPMISFGLMTNKLCIGICKLQGKRFALTEYSSQCFCGNSLQPYAKKPDSDCKYKCSGNANEMCGGFWRGSLYVVNYNDL